MTINIIKDYKLYEKFVPNIYQVVDLKSAPYLFYSNINADVDYICVISDMTIYYPYHSEKPIKRLEEINSKFELLCAPGVQLLVDFKGEPFPIYNFVTGEVLTEYLSDQPVKIKGDYTKHSHLAFDYKNHPVKVGNRLVDQIYILNKSDQFLIGEINPDVVDIFIDMSYYLWGCINPTYDDRKTISQYILPIAQEPTLKTHQTRDITNLIRKLKKSEHKPGNKKHAYNSSDDARLDPIKVKPGEKYSFVKLLERIPEVDDEIDVELDMDVSEWGILNVKIQPEQTLMITIKASVAEKIKKDELAKLFGHENFFIIVMGGK